MRFILSISIMLLASSLCFGQPGLDGLTIHIVRPSSHTFFKGSAYIHVGDTIYNIYEKTYISVDLISEINNEVIVGINNKPDRDIRTPINGNIYILITRVGFFPFNKLVLYELSESGYMQILEKGNIKKGTRKYHGYYSNPPVIRVSKRS